MYIPAIKRMTRMIGRMMANAMFSLSIWWEASNDWETEQKQEDSEKYVTLFSIILALPVFITTTSLSTTDSGWFEHLFMVDLSQTLFIKCK